MYWGPVGFGHPFEDCWYSAFSGIVVDGETTRGRRVFMQNVRSSLPDEFVSIEAV